MSRIYKIINTLYKKVSKHEVKKHLDCEDRLAWLTWDSVDEDMPMTWCEAREAAAVILEEEDEIIL